MRLLKKILKVAAVALAVVIVAGSLFLAHTKGFINSSVIILCKL